MGVSHAKEKLFEYIDREDQTKVAKVLDKYPAIINEPFSNGNPLNCPIRAAWRGDKEMMKFLFTRGANFNNSVNGGYNPLMWTAIKGHFKAMKWLIEKAGVETDICDSEGFTPLDNAIVHANYECAIYLKKKVSGFFDFLVT